MLRDVPSRKGREGVETKRRLILGTIYSSLCFVLCVYYAGTLMSPSLLIIIAVVKVGFFYL